MRIFPLVASWLMLLGCAPHGEVLVLHGMLPDPPPEALRAELGAVWIESSFAEGPTEFVITPAVGKGSGFGRGAGGGAGIGCALLGWPAMTGNPFGIAIGIVGCAGGAAVGALAGGVYGAVTAEPMKSAQKALSIIHETMGRNTSQLALRDRVRALARREAGGRLASEPGAATTRLEIALTAVQLDGVPRPDPEAIGFYAGVIDPALRLVVTAEAKLLRSDGTEELYSAQLEHWGGRRTVPHWAEDEGAPLRREIDHALDDLAEQIVDSVFLLQREP
jgi:hypothetical protein